jgi:hypothetical protein
MPSWKIERSVTEALKLVDKRRVDLIFMDQYTCQVLASSFLERRRFQALRPGVKSRICGLSANDVKKLFLPLVQTNFQ